MPEMKYDKLSEQLERMIRGGAFGNQDHRLSRWFAPAL